MKILLDGPVIKDIPTTPNCFSLVLMVQRQTDMKDCVCLVSDGFSQTTLFKSKRSKGKMYPFRHLSIPYIECFSHSVVSFVFTSNMDEHTILFEFIDYIFVTFNVI